VTRDDVIARLRGFILHKIVKQPSLSLDDDEPLITGGLMDSMSLAYLGVFIEDEFGVRIPDNDLTVEAMDTLVQMADRVLRDAR
jgi:acyl carrier protein